MPAALSAQPYRSHPLRLTWSPELPMAEAKDALKSREPFLGCWAALQQLQAPLGLGVAVGRCPQVLQQRQAGGRLPGTQQAAEQSQLCPCLGPLHLQKKLEKRKKAAQAQKEQLPSDLLYLPQGSLTGSTPTQPSHPLELPYSFLRPSEYYCFFSPVSSSSFPPWALLVCEWNLVLFSDFWR